MFLGHFVVGFGAKRVAPTVSLGTLFAARQLADLIWPALVLTGVEAVEVQPGATPVTPLDFIYDPYSHSLVALLAWALVFAVGHRLLRRGATAASVTLGGLVVSHWVRDVLTHRPDVPLTVDGPLRLGLGLLNSVPATVGVEGPLFGLGVLLYWRMTSPRARRRRAEPPWHGPRRPDRAPRPLTARVQYHRIAGRSDTQGWYAEHVEVRRCREGISSSRWS